MCKALQEIERVHQKIVLSLLMHIEIIEEKKRMENWNLTIRAIMHIEEWKNFFADVGYSGISNGSHHEKKYSLL